MVRRMLRVAGAVALPWLSVSAWSTDYFVGRDGSDTHPGTSAELAWATLEAANSRVFQPGDRLLLEAGGRFTGQLRPKGSGAEGRPVALDRYGAGPNPVLDGQGKVEATLYLYNVEYVEVRHLEIANATFEPEKGRRNGVFIHLDNFGPARGIRLENLHIRDIAGVGNHGSNGGDGIAYLNEGARTPSWFDGLTIERCRIERTHLNGIWGWSAYWNRKPWHPNLNVVIRGNQLVDIGMSGIVPVGCAGAVVEHNRVIRPSRGGHGIGIWPWSCDDTVVQFNEVHGSDGDRDSQAFDSDWNSRNSLFQYNYSHDNRGGFMLICTQGLSDYNIGCEGTVVRYNISENDGATSGHVFHIAGPCRDTAIYNNTIYTGSHLRVNLLEHLDWDGWADLTRFHNNVVHADGKVTLLLGRSTRNIFEGNAWYGAVENRPEDPRAVLDPPRLRAPGQGGTITDTRTLGFLDAYMAIPGSPLIDRGLDLRRLLGVDVGARDVRGRPIPLGSGFDIGACEYDGDRQALEPTTAHPDMGAVHKLRRGCHRRGGGTGTGCRTMEETKGYAEREVGSGAP